MRISGKVARWAVGIAGGLLLLSAADADGLRRYLRLRGQLAELEARNVTLAEENARLAAEIDALGDDPVAMERAAREELGFIRPGEMVFNLE